MNLDSAPSSTPPVSIAHLPALRSESGCKACEKCQPPSCPTAETGPSLSTLQNDGSRRWLFPRLATGRWWQRRRVVAYLLMIVFVVIPHLRIGGKPLILLDVAAREFTVWGRTFSPTDTLALVQVDLDKWGTVKLEYGTDSLLTGATTIVLGKDTSNSTLLRIHRLVPSTKYLSLIHI